MNFEHDALARDLADQLRAECVMTWCDIQLGSSGSVRPDVYTINKSFASPCPTAYECKVSKSDFRADVTTGKWQTYLKYSSAVYFACEQGLLDKRDVPAHCGLIVRFTESGKWRRVKRAILGPVVIPQEALLKLLIDGVEREGPRYRRKAWEEGGTEKYSKKFGSIAARAASDLTWAHRQIKSAEQQGKWILERAQTEAENIRKAADVSPQRTELCELLGISKGFDRWAIDSAIRKLKRELAEHPAQTHHRMMTDQMQRALSLYGFKESVSEETVDA